MSRLVRLRKLVVLFCDNRALMSSTGPIGTSKCYQKEYGLLIDEVITIVLINAYQLLSMVKSSTFRLRIHFD